MFDPFHSHEIAWSSKNQHLFAKPNAKKKVKCLRYTEGGSYPCKGDLNMMKLFVDGKANMKYFTKDTLNEIIGGK